MPLPEGAHVLRRESGERFSLREDGGIRVVTVEGSAKGRVGAPLRFLRGDLRPPLLISHQARRLFCREARRACQSDQQRCGFCGVLGQHLRAQNRRVFVAFDVQTAAHRGQSVRERGAVVRGAALAQEVVHEPVEPHLSRREMGGSDLDDQAQRDDRYAPALHQRRAYSGRQDVAPPWRESSGARCAEDGTWRERAPPGAHEPAPTAVAAPAWSSRITRFSRFR